MEQKGIRRFFGSRQFYGNAVMIALPVMLQQLIQNLVSLIDNFMVAGLGDIKMSAVNVAGQLLFVFMVMFNALCASGGIFMTQYCGAEDKYGMRQALRFKIVTVGFSLLLYFLVTIGIPDQALSLMLIGNSEAESILTNAHDYMTLMSFIGIPMAVSTIIASSLREIGEVKAPLYISVFATIVNTVFNWFWIYGNMGFPRLEIVGAAYATILARIVEMVLYIIILLKKKPAFLFKISETFKIDFPMFRGILKKSSMVMFSEMMWVISETICTALYNGRGGADVVSGMASSFAIANLFFVSFSGITTATGIIIGKTLGRGELDEARKQKTWMLSAAVVFGLAMTGFGLATMLLIPVVFGNLSLQAQSICHDMVLTMSLLMPLWVYSNTQFAVSRSGGDTMMGVLVDGITNVCIIIPGMFLMAYLTDFGPVVMYIIIKAVDVIKIVIAHIWLKKETWVKNLTVAQ